MEDNIFDMEKNALLEVRNFAYSCKEKLKDEKEYLDSLIKNYSEWLDLQKEGLEGLKDPRLENVFRLEDKIFVNNFSIDRFEFLNRKNKYIVECISIIDDYIKILNSAEVDFDDRFAIETTLHMILNSLNLLGSN